MSFLNLNRQAEGYLNPPADRPRWPDTWTLRRTRGEALGRLLAAYAGWQRTIAGGIAPLLVIGGAYLLGMGLDGDAGWVSIVLTVVGVLIGITGLLACGVVLVTGLTVVGALRAWAAIRAQDGGPGVRALFTAAGVVRAVLAVLALAGGVWLVLGLLDVVDPVLESPGGRFASWAAAGMGVIAGVVALLGFVLVAAAVRRIPAGKGEGRPAAGPDGGGVAAPGGAPGQGAPPVPPMPGTPGAPGVPAAPQGQAPWAAGPGEPGQGRSAYGGAGYGSLATGAAPPEPAAQAGYGTPAQPFEAGAGTPAQQPEAPWQGGYAPSAPAGADASQGEPEHGAQGGSALEQTHMRAEMGQPGEPEPGDWAPPPDAVPPPAPLGEAPAPGTPVGEPPSGLEATAVRPGAEDPGPDGAADVDDTRLVAGSNEPARVRFHMDDGRVMGSEGVSLLGRSPAARDDEPVATLVTLADSAVSKTHLALRIEGARAWVTDRASTNGTLLVTSAGEERRLVPWEETPVAPGEALHVGTSVLRVELDRAPGAATLSRDGD